MHACRIPEQEKVLYISDAALVKECEDILSACHATTASVQQASQSRTSSSATGMIQPQAASLDIMDAETQLLQVLPAASATHIQHEMHVHSPSSADHMHKTSISASLDATDEAATSADVHDRYTQPAISQKPDCQPLHQMHSPHTESAGEPQPVSIDRAAPHVTQASASHGASKPVPSAAAHLGPDSATKTATNNDDSSMSALLRAMLTGDLAPY